MAKKKQGSSTLGVLRPSKFASSSSGLSQGSAIDDNCSMDEQEDYLMGDNVFDNFATGLDLSDKGSHESGGADENADVFEDSIFLKTKKKSCKTYWLQLLGIDAFFYKKQTDADHDFMHCLKGTYIKQKECEELNEEGLIGYPIKIVLSQKKARVLYFASQEMSDKWIKILRTASGCSDIFDFYEFKEKLGEGQYGVVYKAEHKSTKKMFAVKTAKKVKMQPEQIEFQRKEIETLKVAQHPNIVRLHDIFEDDKFFFIVLEYIPGGDLYDYMLDRKFNISEDRARQLCHQIADAVSFLHKFGIVHRDLKLENIIMMDATEASVPKLVDFGLAKMIGPGEVANECLGTVAYASPEQLKGVKYDKAVDVWSLGVIFYVLMSGTLPYEGPT